MGRRKVDSRARRLWLKFVVWLRKVLGLDKQRPSPLKEMTTWRM